MSPTVILAAADDEKCSNWASCAVDKGKEVIGGAVNGTKDAINGAKDVGNFLSDPAGNTYKALRDSAKNLAENVLPALTHATLPDLSAEWFINAYRISFGMAVFVFVLLLIPQFVATARGRQSGAELVETLTQYGPLFIIGSMFGPALGAFLVSFFGALSDSLIRTMLSTTAGNIVDEMTKVIGNDDGEGIVGGAVFGSILMFGMVIALGLAFLVLVVQLITLYFSGVLFPLGWVWIVDKKKRGFGQKIPFVWLGVLASHPLLFFLLGVTFSFVGSNITIFTDQPTLQKTVSLFVSMLCLLIAALSPLLLFKFAPVLPMGGASSAGGPQIGANSPQEADQRYSPPTADAGSGDSSSGGESAPTSTTPASSQSAPSQSAPTTGGGASRAGSAGVEEDTAGSTISSAAASGSKAGAGAGAGAGTGAAASAEGGAMAAGAAESSTGVGAVVGIPTMLAAGAKAAADKGNDVATASADMASAPVEDHEEQYGRNSTNE